jgi:hypothetical protein
MTGMMYLVPVAPPAGRAAEAEADGTFVSVAPAVLSLGANTSFVAFEGLRLEHSRGTAVAGPPLGRVAGAAAVRNVTFRGCVLANAGGDGLALHDCYGCAVEGTEVYGVGGSGITLSGGGGRRRWRHSRAPRLILKGKIAK